MSRFLSAKALLLAAGVCLTFAPLGSQANERRFSYSYETTTMPKGLWEYEQWFTWKAYDDKDRFEFRHEFEYGITDNLTIDLYLSDWRIDNPDVGDTEAEWRTAGAALRYMMTDPNKSWLGSGLYGEFLIGPEKMVLEGKLLLQKNFGPLVAVYNGILEAEWEGSSYEEEVAVWENTVGLSYQFSPNFLAGVEALHEIEFPEWSDAGDHVFYAGPNVSFRKGSFFATVAGLFQVSDVEGEPDHQVRLIAGFHF